MLDQLLDTQEQYLDRKKIKEQLLLEKKKIEDNISNKKFRERQLKREQRIPLTETERKEVRPGEKFFIKVNNKLVKKQKKQKKNIKLVLKKKLDDEEKDVKETSDKDIDENKIEKKQVENELRETYIDLLNSYKQYNKVKDALIWLENYFENMDKYVREVYSLVQDYELDDETNEVFELIDKNYYVKRGETRFTDGIYNYPVFSEEIEFTWEEDKSIYTKEYFKFREIIKIVLLRLRKIIRRLMFVSQKDPNFILFYELKPYLRDFIDNNKINLYLENIKKNQDIKYHREKIDFIPFWNDFIKDDEYFEENNEPTKEFLFLPDDANDVLKLTDMDNPNEDEEDSWSNTIWNIERIQYNIYPNIKKLYRIFKRTKKSIIQSILNNEKSFNYIMGK